MATTGKCAYCGATLLSTDEVCPQCGAPNPNYQESSEPEHQIFQPRTIEELKQYCAERNMPLLRMRFFVGEDFKEPKAFGIYEENGRYIVYKNKADGTRAIRYQGEDEEYAVNELFEKLLDECHNRGIYPDGVPEKGASIARKRSTLKTIVLIAAAVLVLFIGTCAFFDQSHRNDGYYQFGNNGAVYYHYGDSWYYDSTDFGWVETDAPSYEGDASEYFLGEDYTSDWGVSDFKKSEMYEELTSSSSDYDSWDMSDTDWDSDW